MPRIGHLDEAPPDPFRSSKEFRVRTRPHEHDRPVIGAVNQKEVAADVTLAVARPFALEGVIVPLRPQRLSGDEQEHGLRESTQVVSAGGLQPHPVLEEG